MATERHNVVIGVEYVGDRDVQRYLAAMQRLGAITAEAQEKLNRLTTSGPGQAPSSMEIARVLDASSRSAMTFDSHARAALGTTQRMIQASTELNRVLRDLQGTMRSRPSGDVFGNLRQQMSDLLSLNQLAKSIQDLGNLRFAEQGLQPGGRPAGVTDFRLQKITSAYVAPDRALTDYGRRVTSQTRRIEEATSATLDFTAAQRADTRAVQQVTAARQQLARALQGEASMLALPAGRRPRTTDFGLPGPSRFIGRDRALELAQEQFRTALRRRTASEDAAGLEALRAAAEARRARIAGTDGGRSQGFYGRLSGLEERGATLDLSQSGELIARFNTGMDRASRNLLSLGSQIKALDEQITAASTTVPTAQVLNRFVGDLNRELIQGFASTVGAELRASGTGGAVGAGTLDPRFGIDLAGEIEELANRIGAVGSGRPGAGGGYTQKGLENLLYHGEVTSGVYNKMSPELRTLLTGDAGAARGRDINATSGIPVQIPGLNLYSRESGLREMRNQEIAPLYEELRNLTRQLSPGRQLPGFGDSSTGVQNAQDALRQQRYAIQSNIAAHQALTRELERQVRAERLASAGASYPGLGRRRDFSYGPATAGPQGTQYFVAPGEAWARGPQGQIGALVWNQSRTTASAGGFGEIQMVDVLEEFRRMGIASQMMATAIEAGYNPRHSPTRSRAGDAWARSVGGGLPELEGGQFYQDMPNSSSGLRRSYFTLQDFNRRDAEKAQLVPAPGFGAGAQAMPQYERAYAAVNARSREGFEAFQQLFNQSGQKALETADVIRRRTAEIRRAEAAAAGAGGAGAGGSGSGGFGGGGFGGGGRGTPFPPPPEEGPRKSFRQMVEEEIAAQQSAPATKVATAQASVYAAEKAADRIAEKAELGFSDEKGHKGFRDEEAAREAMAAALGRLRAAYARLNTAVAAEEAARKQSAATGSANTGRFHGPTMPLLGSTTAAVDAALRQGGAIPTQTPVQAAAQQLAAAQQQLAAATKAHAQVMNGQYKNQTQASQAYASSLGNLTAAQNAVKTAQAGFQVQQNIAATRAAGFGGGGWNGGTPPGGGFGGFGAGRSPGGGFFNDFAVGFHGRMDRSYAEQLGQTFKFSTMYGAAYKLLFAVTSTMAATLQEAIEFQQGMTELAIATGRPKEELDELADSVGRASVAAGFAPSQGMEIAARAQGLYGVTGADAATQDAVGRISAQVVSRLAVGAKKDPVTLQGDIAAIVQALGMDATGQQRIADLDAYMTKKFGIQQGSTLETIAQSASVGKAAGFTNEELFAIAADMQSRTGQTSSAVAGFMAQIFSRGGEGSLVDVARREGIDPTQELQAIIKQLAAVYSGATPQRQAEISAAFGRGKIQNAAVALLGDYDEVIARSQDAAGGAAQGVADATFQERMGNLGGELAILMGLFKQFASELGQSGILDLLGAGVLVLQEFLEALNALLGTWNDLGNVTQDVILGFGLLLAAIRSETVQRALSNRYMAMQGVTGAGRGGIPLATATASQRGMAAFSTAAGALVNPMTLALGGLLALGSLSQSATSMNDAMLAASQTLAAGANMETAADYRNQAALLGTTATQNRNATGWLMNAISFGTADDQNLAVAARMDREAKRLQQVALGLETDEAKQAATFQAPSFAGFGASDLENGLKAITDAGGTAATQFDALAATIFGTVDAAKAATDQFDARKFADRAAAGLVGTTSQGINEFLGSVNPDTGEFNTDAFARRLGNPDSIRDNGFWNVVPILGPYIKSFRQSREGDPEKLSELQAQINNNLGEFMEPTDVAARLRAGVDKLGIDSRNDLKGGKLTALAKYVGQGAAEAALAGTGASPEEIAKLQDEINRWMEEELLNKYGPVRDLSRGNLTADEGAAFSSQLLATSEADISSMGETDLRGRTRRAREALAAVRRTQARSAFSPQLAQNVTAAQRQLAEAEFAELEAMRKTAQQNATSKAQIQAFGRRFINRAIRSAVRNRSGDVLAEIIGNSGKASIAIAREAINEAIKVAQAAVDAAAAIAREAGVLGPMAADFLDKQIAFLKSIDAPIPQNLKDAQKALNAGSAAQADLDKLQGMKGPVNNTQYDPEATMDKGLDSKNPKLDKWYDESEKAEEDKETAAERAAARAAAFAQRSEGSIDAARASILSAKASIAEADKNSVEYWNAMGELFSAQNALADAVQAHQKNLMMLNADMTNPLQMARIETRAAAIKLREDIRSGAAADVIAQDRVDLRSARANQEATAFSQRLQSVQTAEELGRISHSKYINYLENERDRLNRIKNRTFQQQEQLDQIDRLLQDASKQMQGQFNLGDIKLPTPYQVRRYIEEASGAGVQRMAASAGAGNTTNLTMYVDGADTAKVIQTVEKYVGKAARTKTVTPRRR